MAEQRVTYPRSLRLFPLRSVLFPGATMPLQVFEDRYRRLIAECLEESAPFGIVLIREGVEVGGPAVPHDVGTVAAIDSVVTAASGRLLVRAGGRHRFRIVELHHDRPYLHAEVEYPLDEHPPPPESLLEEARARYELLHRLRLTASGEYRRSARSPACAGALADAIASQAGGSADQLQPVLEELRVRRRLERALELLDGALTAAHRSTTAAVAERWGGLGSRN